MAASLDPAAKAGIDNVKAELYRGGPTSGANQSEWLTEALVSRFCSVCRASARQPPSHYSSTGRIGFGRVATRIPRSNARQTRVESCEVVQHG